MKQTSSDAVSDPCPLSRYTRAATSNDMHTTDATSSPANAPVLRATRTSSR